MKSRALFMVLALALAVPGGARAGHGASACGDFYTTQATCALVFRGFPLRLDATVTAPAGTVAEVRVWITTEHDLAPLFECSARGEANTASCSAVEPANTPLIEHPVLGQFAMLCHVRSNGTGAYSCVSASGV